MWFYSSPRKIVFGPGSLKYLGQIKPKKVFIVTDKVCQELGFTDLVIKNLKSNPEIQIFNEIMPNPILQVVEKGGKLCQDFGPDLIIGLGGGSVIDAGKGIWFLNEFPDKNIRKISFTAKLEMKKAEYICIPTTSGTGSDANWAVVYTDTEADGVKTGYGSRDLVPMVSVLDPVFPKNMPQKLTMGTGLDVLTHAVEGYITSFKNEIADGHCLNAIRLLFENLEQAVKNGDDMKARNKVHIAATVAGLGFGNSQAGIAHSIGHACGAVFYKPHGQCVGLALRYIIQFGANREPDVKKWLAEIAQRSLDIWEPDDDKAYKELLNAMKDFYQRIGAPMTLKDLGISEQDFKANFDKFVKFADEDPCSTTNKPIPETEELAKIIQYIWDGKDIDF
ncbi:MAG: iron-containing alcohol dehydrogenase [Candidatus Hodarchaeota archaeon]